MTMIITTVIMTNICISICMYDDNTNSNYESTSNTTIIITINNDSSNSNHTNNEIVIILVTISYNISNVMLAIWYHVNDNNCNYMMSITIINSNDNPARLGGLGPVERRRAGGAPC